MKVTRRRFLALMGMFGASMALPRVLRGDNLPPMLVGRWRITVVRRQCLDDLQSRFLCDPEAGPCPKFATGDQFCTLAGEIPQGFCPMAWEAICSVMSARAGVPCTRPDGGGAVVCCPDGTRPVSFRVESLS